MTATTYEPPKMEFRKAWNALQALIADPEDTNQVFIIMRALTGKSFYKQYLKFRRNKMGAQVLKEKRNLIDTLVDREALKQYPEGTLGKAYIDFMIREGISA